MVAIKDVSGNADNGDATHWGGNQIMLVDGFLDNVDISASLVNGTGRVRINTPTAFRDQKFILRNPGDTFSYIFVTSALTANRNITVPLITSNGNLILSNFANTFTERQIIMRDNAQLLTLYRDNNANGSNIDLEFDAEDSVGSAITYGRISGEIVDNTTGSADGKLEFSTRDNGSLLESMVINIDGSVDILRGPLRITDDGTSDLLELYRTDNAVFDNISINFFLQDSGSAKQQYSAITAEIGDNTAGSEDGVLIFRNFLAGTLRNSATLYADGYWDLYRATNTALDYNGIGFDLNNSSSTRVAYAEIKGEIRTNTAGAEDGRVAVSTKRGGSMIRTHEFRNDGNLSVSRDGSVFRHVPSIIDCSGVVVDTLNTGAETTAVSFTVQGSTMGNNGCVHLRVLGVLKQNGVTATNYHFRLKVGGTTVWSDNLGPALTQSATNCPFMLDIDFANMNSTSSNRIYVLAALNDTSAPSTGEGDITDDEGHALQFGKSFVQSINTTSDFTMAVTIDMDQTQAATGWEMQYYRATLYPQ